MGISRCGFDPVAAEVSFGLGLDPAHSTVMQCVFVDDVTREVFVSQARTGTQPGRETTVVSRHTPAGVFVDAMTFTDAGHGTCVFSETTGEGTFVWLNVIRFDTDGSSQHQLVRVPWQPGASLTGQDVARHRVDTFTSLYTLVNPDFRTGLVLVRETSGSTETQYLRRFADLVAGRDVRVSREIVTSTASEVVQGFATVGDEWFVRYLGSSTPGTGVLQFWDWVSGELAHVVSVESARFEADGLIADSFSEPEGLSVFRDRAGNAHVVFGVSGGVSGRRTHRVYSLGVGGPFVSEQARVARHTALLEPDLAARRPNPAVTSLGSLVRPGWTYLSSDEFAQVVDGPAGATGAHMLEVSARNPDGTAVVQRLSRFSTSSAGVWQRVVDFVSGVAGEWVPLVGGVSSAPSVPAEVTTGTYTPALTNVTLGSGGTASGSFVDDGVFVDGDVVIELGTGGATTGTVRIGLPVPAHTALLVPGAQEVARGTFWDASASRFVPAVGVPPNTAGTELQIRYVNTAGDRVTGVPFTFNEGDRLVLSFRYRKAAV